jgi:hypothetical protein
VGVLQIVFAHIRQNLNLDALTKHNTIYVGSEGLSVMKKRPLSICLAVLSISMLTLSTVPTSANIRAASPPPNTLTVYRLNLPVKKVCF